MTTEEGDDMPAVNVDCAFLESDDLFEISRELGDFRAAYHVIRLWAWAIQSESVDGVVTLDKHRLSRICDWRGDVDLLWNTITSEKHKIVRRVSDDRWYLRGWEKHNGRYMRERFRSKKRYEERKKTESESTECIPAVIPAGIPRQDRGPLTHALTHDQKKIHEQTPCQVPSEPAQCEPSKSETPEKPPVSSFSFSESKSESKIYPEPVELSKRKPVLLSSLSDERTLSGADLEELLVNTGLDNPSGSWLTKIAEGAPWSPREIEHAIQEGIRQVGNSCKSHYVLGIAGKSREKNHKADPKSDWAQGLAAERERDARRFAQGASSRAGPGPSMGASPKTPHRANLDESVRDDPRWQENGLTNIRAIARSLGFLDSEEDKLCAQQTNNKSDSHSQAA